MKQSQVFYWLSRLAFAVLIGTLLLILAPGIRGIKLSLQADYGLISIPGLINYLDADEFTRSIARSRIVSHRGEAIDDLTQTLLRSNESSTVRGECASCLGLIGIKSEKVIHSLRLASSPAVTEFVRCKSLCALWRLESDAEQVVPGLTALLSSSNRRVTDEVVRVLSEIGPKAKDAIPALIQLQEKETNRIHWDSIESALRSIHR